jgi:TrmH family RNA methyltransferase
LFVCESLRVIEQVEKLGLKLQNIIIAGQSKYLSKLKNRSETAVVDQKIFESITSLKNGDGVIGVFVKKKLDFQINKGNYVILDRIQNPGNLGSMIRTAVAFDIDGIVITNDSVDIYHPEIIRSTMGSIFSIPIKFTTNLTMTIDQFKDNNFKIYASMLNPQAVNYQQVDFSNKMNVVIFGNEGNGIKLENAKQCDKMIYIPINLKIDSLNVAVAAGIIMARMK